jgi:hypothetical protein
MMNDVLANVMDFLVHSISADGESVGADESFPFFVAVLTEAKISILPTILFVMKEFQLEDLKTTRVGFLVAQLAAARDFVQSRLLPVPPHLLFPAPPSDEAVPLHFSGFAVYAFPFYSEYSPAVVVSWTGDPADLAHLFRYPLTYQHPAQELLSASPSSQGTVYAIPQDAVERFELIKIPAGSYRDAIEDVQVMSNLTLIGRQRTPRPCLSLLAVRLEGFARAWNRNSEGDARESVCEIVRAMQRALVKGGRLPVDYEVSGVIDGRMLAAIAEVIPALEAAVYIDQKIYSQICSMAPLVH